MVKKHLKPAKQATQDKKTMSKQEWVKYQSQLDQIKDIQESSLRSITIINPTNKINTNDPQRISEPSMTNVLSNRTSLNNLHDNEIKNTVISQVDEVLSGSDESNELKYSKMQSGQRERVTGGGHLQILNSNLHTDKVNRNYNIYDVFNPNRYIISNSTKHLDTKNNKDNLILSSTSPINVGDGLQH